jgi:dinuclear metal center YbgI/SA1388 family protein
VKLEQIAGSLDLLLDVRKYSPDSNGLVVQGAPEVNRVGGMVDLSWSALREAADQGVSLIVSHHAAWKSTDVNLVEEKYEFARKAGISIYVTHDSLDHHQLHGTSITLATALQCKIETRFADGIGVIVAATEDRDFDSFARRVRSIVNLDCTVWKSQDVLGKVGIIAGWGARPEWMNLAREAGAATFLSGEAIHFGKLYAKEVGLNLVLAGHYATETFAVKSVIEWISRELLVEAAEISDSESKHLF